MIEDLHIQNFLCFEKLEIPKLGRVNLIAGKNNVGKTALLEALRIYVAEGEVSVLSNILAVRLGKTNVPLSKRDYNNLFNRTVFKETEEQQIIVISQLKIVKEVESATNYFRKFPNKKDRILDILRKGNHPDDKAVYIPFQSNFEKSKEFWDNISLTDKEDAVIEILKNSIEPKLIRLDVGDLGAKIRLKSEKKPLPLSTLGDGMQRILLVALSLANAQGGILLIDEIEAGLHHTVLEKLWGMIFKYARLWDIQVFATTHSQDAVKTFHYVASEAVNKKEAEFIRLQKNRNGKIEAIIYDGKKLEQILDLDLEIR